MTPNIQQKWVYVHVHLCVNVSVGKKYNDTEHSQMPGHWVNRCRAGRTWAVSLCPFARVCSAMVANRCQPKGRSGEGSWEESMPRWSAVHPWGPCWLYQAAPALLSGGGKQAGGGRVSSPTIPSVISTVMHLSWGEPSVISAVITVSQ